MAKKSKAAQGSAAATATATAEKNKFKNMSFIGKLMFISKACAFFITFGFAYPNVFLD